MNQSNFSRGRMFSRGTAIDQIRPTRIVHYSSLAPFGLLLHGELWRCMPGSGGNCDDRAEWISRRRPQYEPSRLHRLFPGL